MFRSRIRVRLYRQFQRRLLKPLLFPVVFPKSRTRSKVFSKVVAQAQVEGARRSPVGWFHASSVGELEMLVPVIEKWSLRQTDTGERFGVILSIFSESAEASLRRLNERLKNTGARVLFSGYAPWEGEWTDVLRAFSPSFFVTARYEAWPECWMGLSELKIPLLIVGAKKRSSLKWAKRVCSWMGIPLPELFFATVIPADQEALQDEFPESEVKAMGDPRWERVLQRQAQTPERVRELMELYSGLPRPWGVLGSVWLEDLGEFEEVLKNRSLKGTLWLVPHQVDPESIQGFEWFLNDLQLCFEKTSEGSSKAREQESASQKKLDCILVNEMGFLTELYQAADWAYVGGGFSDGVHNTIEPAVYGIAIACGPAKIRRFPEIELLQSRGQLTVVKDSSELLKWVVQIQAEQAGRDGPRRVQWIEAARTEGGASDRLLEQLDRWVSRWKLKK